MKNELFIYCSGGVGQETYDIAKRLNSGSALWKNICFIDDVRPTGIFNGVRVLSYKVFSEQFPPDNVSIVIANGEPTIRRELREKICTDGYMLTNVIDPSAIISSKAHIGSGVIVYPLVCISPNVTIHDNTVLYYNVTVAHDSEIGENSVVSIGAIVSGHCKIGNGCFLGAKSAVRESSSVGESSIVGIGATVCSDIEPLSVCIGTPARNIRKNIGRIVFAK